MDWVDLKLGVKSTKRYNINWLKNELLPKRMSTNQWWWIFTMYTLTMVRNRINRWLVYGDWQWLWGWSSDQKDTVSIFANKKSSSYQRETLIKLLCDWIQTIVCVTLCVCKYWNGGKETVTVETKSPDQSWVNVSCRINLQMWWNNDQRYS